MKTSSRPLLRRSLLLAAIGVLVAVLTGCTGRGGGYLPPQSPVFTGQAAFGFTFSCENGDLKIELAYQDKGSNPLRSAFGIKGTADVVDPVVESAVCIDENPPPPPENQLIFLGRYRQVSGSAGTSPSTCPTRETPTSPLCRFEVIVQDNDRSLTPSPGDFFSIKLSTVTTDCSGYPPDPTCSQLPAYPGPTVPYYRAGHLAGGNLTVR